MSEHGVIIEWDEGRGWGAIQLDDGTVVAFNKNACGKGVVCAVDNEIWVAKHVPYIGGKRRATSVQANAEATLTPLDLVKRKSELDEELRQKLNVAYKGFWSRRDERVPHVDGQLAQLGIDVDTTILGDDANETLGVAYQPEKLVARTPFDPCLIAFAGIDSYAWCFFCYPPLLARGEAPVVKWDHDLLTVTFEAATFPHWLAKRAKSNKRASWLAARGFLAPDPVPTTAMAKAVHALVIDAGGLYTGGDLPDRLAGLDYTTSAEADRLARLDDLLACYRALGWPDVLVRRAEVQRELVVVRRAHDAEVARITREHHLAHPDLYPDPGLPTT
jgi:hypothetical protein